MTRKIVIHNHLTGDSNRFQSRGGASGTGSGAYQCIVCGKKTRESGLNESEFEMCKSCLSKTYIENAKNDYGVSSPEYKQAVRQYGKFAK